jgi:hypothetical protein
MLIVARLIRCLRMRLISHFGMNQLEFGRLNGKRKSPVCLADGAFYRDIFLKAFRVFPARARSIRIAL